MANPTPREVLKVPGRLCSGPSDLATAFPHGGTALGLVREATWAGGETGRPITGEEWGGTVVEVIADREAAVFGCYLRGWDKDALAALFLDSAAGGTSGRQLVTGRVQTDGKRPGELLDNSVALYFSPLADQHPGLLIFRAIPLVDATKKLNFSAASELEVGALFYATPDATGRLYEIGWRDDLTL